jgi:predicted DNA-binding protein
METQVLQTPPIKRESPISIRLRDEDREHLEALARRAARTRQGYVKWLIRREAKKAGLITEAICNNP